MERWRCVGGATWMNRGMDFWFLRRAADGWSGDMDTRLKVRRRGGMEVWRRAEGCVDVEVWNSGGALRVVTNCAEGVQTWRHGALEACGRREDGGMEVRVARVGQQVCIHGCMEVQSSRT